MAGVAALLSSKENHSRLVYIQNDRPKNIDRVHSVQQLLRKAVPSTIVPSQWKPGLATGLTTARPQLMGVLVSNAFEQMLSSFRMLDKFTMDERRRFGPSTWLQRDQGRELIRYEFGKPPRQQAMSSTWSIKENEIDESFGFAPRQFLKERAARSNENLSKFRSKSYSHP